MGRTCFFRLEVPLYKTEEAFKEKLLYAIRNCTVIDADIENAVQQEEEQEVQREATPRIRNEGDSENSEDEGGE
jgi:hypothetical protein